MDSFSSMINKYYNNKILMGRLQVEAIAMAILAKSPECNMLVFGVGNDSFLWHQLVKEFGNGKIVFLETSQEWIDKIKGAHPELDIRKYDLKGSTVEASLKAIPEWKEPPAALQECEWDIILIDGPGGFNSKAPGRAHPIIWASKYRQPSTYVYVDDYNRELERIYADKFLGSMNIIHDPNHQTDRNAILAYNFGNIYVQKSDKQQNPRSNDYEYWRDQMIKIARPVLVYGAADQLKEKLGQRVPNNAKRTYAHLEAVGRTICGIAPWIEALGRQPDNSKFKEYISLAQKCIANIVNPAAKDFVNIDGKYTQPLCDSAFLAQGILRARHTLWDMQDDKTKLNIIEFFKKTRKIRPARHNWILFSSMVETFLRDVGSDASYAAIDYGLSQFDQWYVGDGFYKDGCSFAFDYYNSFVIHPMLLDIAERMTWITEEKRENFIARAQRYADILYRLIAPDGSYPLVGRSITYRMGVFHLLAQLVLRDRLPDKHPSGAIRSALTAVLKRIMADPLFDKDGFLEVGVIGKQPLLAEPYINCGSEYLCMTFFCPLGLPADSPFWSSEEKPWISAELWAGKDIKADHVL